ncbi:MAG TPA: hypothetical protein VFE51_11620 [Verrucomicrobiae bacterium]|nr:hypothetical protein [Verrucomicrobiae bacterium]
MTRKQEDETIAEADEIISKAHSMLVDVYYSRKEANATIEGDALTHAIGLLCHALDTLRDTGESPRYLAAWDRKPPDSPGT